MQTINLTQAAEILREQGYELRMGNFGSFDEFKSYWDQHYAPFMDRLRKTGLHLAGFLADDLEKIFNDEN